jgi:hypothetical protein
MNVVEKLQAQSFHMHSNLYWKNGSKTIGVVGRKQEDESFLFREVGCNTWIRIVVIDQTTPVYQPVDNYFGDSNCDCWESAIPIGSELINIVLMEHDQGNNYNDSSRI